MGWILHKVTWRLQNRNWGPSVVGHSSVYRIGPYRIGTESPDGTGTLEHWDAYRENVVIEDKISNLSNMVTLVS